MKVWNDGLAALTVAAALALLAACGGTPSAGGSAGPPHAGTAAATQAGVSYAHCMRSHGVSKFPDPSGSDEVASGLPKVNLQQLEVSGAQYQAAQNSCAYLLPNGGRQTLTQSQQQLNDMRSLAQCMRSHGVPTWPDPTYGSSGRWVFDLTHAPGFDPNSPRINATMRECGHGLFAGTGIPVMMP